MCYFRKMSIDSFLSYRDSRWRRGNGGEQQTPTHGGSSHADGAQRALRLCVLEGPAENCMARTPRGCQGARLPGYRNCVPRNVWEATGHGCCQSRRWAAALGMPVIAPGSAGHGSHRCSLQGRGYLSHRLTLPGYGPPVGGDDRTKGARESGGVPGCGPRPATDQRGASDQPPSPSKPRVPRPYDQCPGLHEPQTKNFVNRPVLHGG